MKSPKQNVKIVIKGFREIHTIRPGIFILMMTRGIIRALMPFVYIYMSARIIDGIALGHSFEGLLGISIITVAINTVLQLGLAVLNHVINVYQKEFDARYEMRLNHKLTTLDYWMVENPHTHLLRQKIDEIRNMNGGGLWKLLDSFVQLSQSAVTILFSMVLTGSLFTISSSIEGLGTVTSFIASPYLSILLIAVILSNVFVNMYANSTATRKSQDIMNDILPFNRVFGFYFTDYISDYRAGKDIRLYNQKQLIMEESNSLFEDAYLVLNKLSRNQVKYSLFAAISSMLLSTSVFLFVGLKALVGLLSIGSIAQYVASIQQFTDGCTNFVTQLAEIRTNCEALEMYFSFLEIPTEMRREGIPIDKTGNNSYVIEFHHVSFRYPNTDNYVLKDICLTINMDKKTAIVGMNGSGKTTMIKLLCRLYEATEGQITLNGINIADYRYEDYMRLFAAVFQDFKMFAFDIGQNVATEVDYNELMVKKCLEQAGFGTRLGGMPNGLKTPLYKDFDENGVEISGGEAQKIAVARALYKEAVFMILDEPTAALDPIAEYDIYLKLSETMKGKAAVYISHRLSSCRFCDTIVVFDQGHIIQHGSHESLLTDVQGKYFELWHAQAQYYAPI